jgi:N-terminal domain of toast_rack, DUF2154
MVRKLIPAFLVLALAVMACSININIPVTSITPGPTVTDQINVPLPAGASDHVDLSLAFGAGTLNLHPGSSEVVSGTAIYNIADFKPTVTASGSNVSIEQGNWKMNGIPTNFSNYKNEWDLSLGTTPLNLDIQAGAYHADYEFGGLALTSLSVKDGAAETKLDFNAPNTASMSMLRYETGASNVSLTGLGNANFSNLDFSCGAGNYTLDFSGALQQAGNVHVKTGVSNMTLVIPTGVSAQITVTGGLSNVSHDSGWSKSGNVYTQSGSGPQLTFAVEIGAGNLTLTH